MNMPMFTNIKHKHYKKFILYEHLPNAFFFFIGKKKIY